MARGEGQVVTATKGKAFTQVRRGFVLRRRYVHLGILGAVVLLVLLLALLRERIADLSGLGYFGVFLVNFAGSAALFVPLPGLAVVLTGGWLWNPVIVGVVAGVAMTLGEVTGYALGYGGQFFLRENHPLRFLERWMLKAGGPIILIGSLIPNPFFDILGIIAGSQRYPLRLFLLWALPGKILKSLAVAFLGSLGMEHILRLLGLV